VKHHPGTRVAPLVVTAGLLSATACIGLHHSPTTTTTIVKSPPHLVALVTLIGAGSTAGSGTTLEAIDLSAKPMTMRAITVGTFPDAVAVAPNGKTAYVTSYTDNSVTPVDLATGKAKKAISVGTGPAGIAIAPNGETAYVTDAGTAPIGDTVTPINLLKSKTLTPIKVGDGPQGIAITPDGTMAYVANAGAIVTGQTGSIGDTVTPIDLSTKTAGPAITVGNAPVGVAISPDGTTVYVTNSNSDSVSTIPEGTTTQGTPVAVNGSPQAVATTGSTAWVANTSSSVSGGNNLSSIQSGATQAAKSVPLGKNPTSVAIAPGGATAWVVTSGDDELVQVNLATGKVVAGSIALPGGPYAVALAEVPALSAKALTTVPVKKAKKATSS
jgi:YVTN family beta-propeller protein